MAASFQLETQGGHMGPPLQLEPISRVMLHNCYDISNYGFLTPL